MALSEITQSRLARAILFAAGGLLLVLAIVPALLAVEMAFLTFRLHSRREPDPYIHPYADHTFVMFGDHQFDTHWVCVGATLMAMVLMGAGLWLIRSGFHATESGMMNHP